MGWRLRVPSVRFTSPTLSLPLTRPSQGPRKAETIPRWRNRPRSPRGSGNKVLTVLQIKKVDSKWTAAKLLELLPKAVTVAAVRDENALLVYATPKGTEDVRLVLRTLGEELPKEAAKPAEPKRHTFSFSVVPWSDVLDWYAKETGLTMVSTVKPIGSFSCVPPRGKQFTLEEITDILNETLAQQKLILIRRHMTFFLHPADEKIDPRDIPRVELSGVVQTR